MDLKNNNIQNNYDDEEINELKNQLNELEFISDRTKEYLFVLESELDEKNKKINSLKGDIKKKNKKINSLKGDIKKKNKEIKTLDKRYKKVQNENLLLKSSTSWKITAPLRKIVRFIKRN